jgi:hypothetical protein
VIGRDWSSFGHGMAGTVSPNDAGELFQNPKLLASDRNRLTVFDKAGFTDDPIQQVRAFSRLKQGELIALVRSIKAKNMKEIN